MAGVFLCAMLKLSIAPYRLLFKQPFGTAHGFRDGTDSIFVRLERNGITGFGEATMPPYVKEDQRSVIQALERVDLHALDQGDLLSIGEIGPSARAGLTTAYFDLVSSEEAISIAELLEVPKEPLMDRISLITLGLCAIDDIPSKLDQLPKFNGLKIKLDGIDDEARIDAIMRHDDRPVLIDANQAWDSVDQAFKVLDRIDPKRLIGSEQPFPVDRPDLQQEFTRRIDVTVFADESIQDRTDLEKSSKLFTGINLKLMKCGGLDRALDLACSARATGMRIMLGSMSESSIGCSAMLHLSTIANVLDLDGPWLISNDPFNGLQLVQGEMKFSSQGPIAAPELNWRPIGA